MGKNVQGRLPLTNVPARKLGRVRRAIEKEVKAARLRGVDVSAASVTVCYVLADEVDRVDTMGDDRYLLPQLCARLLEERRAANLLPERVENEADLWTQLSQSLNLDTLPTS